MINRLTTLSKYHNVSGCETQIIEWLRSHLENCGFLCNLKTDGCIVATQGGAQKSGKQTVMLSVPIDIPGFISLYTDKKSAYLAQTGNLDVEEIKNSEIVDEQGVLISVECNSDAKDEFLIHKNGIKSGDSFSLRRVYSSKKDNVEGWFAAQSSLILMICELLELKPSCNLIFAFVGSSATRASKEINLVNQFHPDYVVFTSTCESDGLCPVVCVKDGNTFSDDRLIALIRSISDKMGISCKWLVSNDSITKLTSVVSETAVPALSLALPCKNRNKRNESFSLSSFRQTKDLLSEFLLNL